MKYFLFVLSICFICIMSPLASAETKSGSVGIEGKISSDPPKTAASISSPANGQSFSTVPIDVVGSCPRGTLVKLFKNNVFSGSAICESGSYRISIDLFSGQNDLVARVYDALDQAGPDSNNVSVNFNDSRNVLLGARVTLTSNYAKRGAFPGEKVSFPLVVSGGTAPYAISVDWGDGKPADLITQEFSGTFTAEHQCENPGVYNIIIKAIDKTGSTAFLQLVAVCNGPLNDGGTTSNGSGSGKSTTNIRRDSKGNIIESTNTVERRILWQPAVISIPFIFVTFWLGRRHALYVLRRRIEKGERAFR